ncbi:MAG: hypothetical protein WA532_00350 [Candidatus Korobacteraceae bacterium]
MESQVITVGTKEIAQAIVNGLRLWFESDPTIREEDGGWTVLVTGIVPESVRLLMNHYSLGVLDCKTGRV